MYVLWLSSWFPNKTSPYNGDFIARHAAATSGFIPIVVVHAVKDPGAVAVTIEESWLTPGCRQVIIYYPQSSSIPWLEKLISAVRYIYLQFRFIRQLFREQGKPDLVHLHIIVKAGIIALMLNKMYRIPYMVSEQATHYLREDVDSFHRSSFLTKWLIRSTLANATRVTAVSRVLANAMKNFQNSIEPLVIPNVVDKRIFFAEPGQQALTPFRLIHISNFFYQKNAEDILEAYAILHASAPGQFELIVAGGAPEDSQELNKWEQMGVVFAGEMKQEQLAELIRNAHALILYSRYETFGCVIIEAMACGLPVIVSDIDVFHETVSQNVNGCFAAPESPQKLADEIRKMRSNYHLFNRPEISERALKKYSFELVGKAFSDLYKEARSSL